jgi:hypothetical protein
MSRKKHIQISIPSPCQQDWSGMQPDGRGRFCNNCQATVTDFTQMSDVELARIMTQRDAPHCGRFLQSQVNRPMLVEAAKLRFPWPRLAAGAALLMLTMPHALLSQTGPAPAQDIAAVVETPAKPKIDPAPDPVGGALATIKGTVIHADNGRPYAGATVSVFPFTETATTDSLGAFVLQVDLEKLPDTFALHIVLPDYAGEKEIPIHKADMPTALVAAVTPEPQVMLMGVIRRDDITPRRIPSVVPDAGQRKRNQK